MSTMSRRRQALWIAGAIVASVGLTDRALGEMITYHNEFQETAPFVKTISLPLFDPSMGDLESAYVYIDWDYSSTIYMENLDPDNGADWFVNYDTYSLSIAWDFWGVIWDNNLYAGNYGAPLQPFDGVVDYDGPSGITFGPWGEDAWMDEYTPPGSSFLGLYIGSGDMEFTMSISTDNDWGVIGDDWTGYWEGIGTLSVDVTYTYVPEPGCLAMMGVGVLVMLRRR